MSAAWPRSVLGAAAADLAIAERLLRTSVAAVVGPVPMRGAVMGGQEVVITQALRQPESFIEPVAFSRYRSSSELQNLQAGVFACLDGIRKDTVAAGKDAITDMLTMDFALLKEAAELLGADIAAKLRDSAVGLLGTAVEYVLAATDKLRLLLGAEGESRVKQAVLGFIDQLREDKLATQAVERFLHTEAIYVEAKGWMQAYEGDPQALVAAAETLEALRGSFAGRRKLIEVIVRGITAARLLPALRTPPWGPIAIAAAYLATIGYLLFSAYDHVDSDRYPFFDRVTGVRGVLIDQLGVVPTSESVDVEPT